MLGNVFHLLAIYAATHAPIPDLLEANLRMAFNLAEEKHVLDNWVKFTTIDGEVRLAGPGLDIERGIQSDRTWEIRKVDGAFQFFGSATAIGSTDQRKGIAPRLAGSCLFMAERRFPQGGYIALVGGADMDFAIFRRSLIATGIQVTIFLDDAGLPTRSRGRVNVPGWRPNADGT